MNNQLLSTAYDHAPDPVDKADIVIIGNGIAGLTAALEARHLEPDKQIVIITDQIHPTINTPALKQFAIGKLTREQLLAYPAGTEKAERIHIVNAHVDQIHARSKYLTLNGNSSFGYDTLLISTGSTPQGLSDALPGKSFDGVMTLHRLQDYLDLRRRMGETNEAVVVGGGVHAIETVMGLLPWGIRVHWLIRGKTFMGRILDETASEMVLQNMRRAGVQIHLETEITGIVGRVGAVAGVITNHQQMLPCQLVLCCTGTSAAKELAQECSIPLQHKNGIFVDDKLRTSVRDIYAAGDVAALRNPQTGSYEPRAQWYAAVTQGRIAGAMMVGHNHLAQQPFGVQWHATHLGELSMLTVGNPLSQDPRIEVMMDTSQGNYRRIALLDNRLVGYQSLGAAQPDSLAIKRIIDDGYPVRDFIKPLLKGHFDARAYLSSNHSRITRRLMTGELPAPTSQNPMPTPFMLPSTPTAYQQPAAYTAQQISGESFNPFTGNLPNISMPPATAPSYPLARPHQKERDTDPIKREQVAALPLNRSSLKDFYSQMQEPSSLPQAHNHLSGNDRTPFTGQVARNALQQPPQARTLHYKIWSYTNEQAPVLTEEDR